MSKPSGTEASTNRRLLAALAQTPAPTAPTPWSSPARNAAEVIGGQLTNDEHNDIAAISFIDLHHWRSQLDHALAQLATNQDLWQHWC